MFVHRCATRLVIPVTIGLAAIAAASCGSSSMPTTPTTTLTVTAVALTATNIATGKTTQGTVSLSAAATAATSVALLSSNPSAATVQSPVTVQVGASSATFTVTAVGAGTAMIAATLNGATSQSPVLTITSVNTVAPALASLTLSTSAIVGGYPATGTVNLSGPAPAAGVLVSLSGGDPLTVPANVMVPAGQASATFTIATRAVGGAIPGTVSASYAGASTSATLSVTALTATLGVTGPLGADACTLTNNGTALDCSFVGTASAIPGTIPSWEWTYGMTTLLTPTTTTSELKAPAIACGVLPPPPLPAGVQWLTMTVKLRVRDDLGNFSAEAVDANVRLFPQGMCGY